MRSMRVAVLGVERQIAPVVARLPAFEPVEHEQEPDRTLAAHFTGQLGLAVIEFGLAEHAAHLDSKDAAGFLFERNRHAA